MASGAASLKDVGEASEIRKDDGQPSTALSQQGVVVDPEGATDSEKASHAEAVDQTVADQSYNQFGLSFGGRTSDGQAGNTESHSEGAAVGSTEQGSTCTKCPLVCVHTNEASRSAIQPSTEPSTIMPSTTPSIKPTITHISDREMSEEGQKPTDPFSLLDPWRR